MTLLSCESLEKRYGDRTAVAGISFGVAPGEAYGLLGPNGAGKTTTVSMICGLLRPDAGEVTVAGARMGPHAAEAKGKIGYVPQDIALYPDLTAHENLTFFGKLYGLDGAALRGRVAEALETVGLSDRASDRVDTYSGGMKRRLNIAAALLHRPTLLVLDEPTVGVDPQSRNAILEAVEALSQDGAAVLYTTHYMEEAERLCDRVGIMDEGRIVAEGTRRELVEQIAGRDHVRIEGQGDLPRFATAAQGLDAVEDATVSDGEVELVVMDARRVLPKLLEIADREGVRASSIEVVEPDLEAVFLHLTGKALRD